MEVFGKIPIKVGRWLMVNGQERGYHSKKNLSKPLMNVPPTGGTSNDGRKRRRGIVA